MAKNQGTPSFESLPLTPAEKVCRTHLVEDMVDMQVMNIQNHFLQGAAESSQVRAKIGEVLETLANEMAEKIIAATEFKRIDPHNPKWREEIGNQTHAYCKKHLPEYFNNGGELLAIRLSDEFGYNPEDWKKEERIHKLNVVVLRLLQFVSAAALCEKFGLDVDKIKTN